MKAFLVITTNDSAAAMTNNEEITTNNCKLQSTTWMSIATCSRCSQTPADDNDPTATTINSDLLYRQITRDDKVNVIDKDYQYRNRSSDRLATMAQQWIEDTIAQEPNKWSIDTSWRTQKHGILKTRDKSIWRDGWQFEWNMTTSDKENNTGNNDGTLDSVTAEWQYNTTGTNTMDSVRNPAASTRKRVRGK